MAKITKYKYFIFFVFISNFGFSQNKILNNIKTYNEEGNYQKSLKQILKYKDKNYDTLNCNYLICLSDYYSIVNNNEYNPLKAFLILNNLKCEKVISENFGIFFKDIQECNSEIKSKRDKYINLYYNIVIKSNNLDSLKSFKKEFENYNELTNKISQKIITVVEQIDYDNAIKLNTIESYLYFLKFYSKSSKAPLIRSNLENLSWEKCLQTNTKESYQSFIRNFPLSIKLKEATAKLKNFVDTFDLNKIMSSTTIGDKKQVFNSFAFSKKQQKFTFLKISNNGKIALVITNAGGGNRFESDNIGHIVDLNNGTIIFEFPYLTISDYFFNPEDSKLFYCDNKFIKQLDLEKFEISNLFELESSGGYSFTNVVLDKNVIHVCQDKYEYPRKKILHYSYDLTTTKKDLEVFYEYEYSIRNDIQKQYNFISGNNDQKLLMLKLINGDYIKIKPLTKDSKDEYLILNFPNVFILKSGQFVSNSTIQLFETNKITKEITSISNEINDERLFNKEIQLTDNNRIVFTTRNSLYVLQLFSNDGSINYEELKTYQLDPFEISIPSNDRFLFVNLNENTGNLYYQIYIGHGCGSDDEIYIYDIENKLISKEQEPLKVKIIGQLKEIDNTLFNYYNSYINIETIKNQPLESDIEKYARIKDINNKITPKFIFKQDSLFNILNKSIEEAVLINKYESEKLFNVKYYDQKIEAWKLVFKNPYDGKDFSLIYPQSKTEAKSNLNSKFSNINIEVNYYFNLLSLAFEPLLVSITNVQTKIKNKYIIPYRDASLLKNLYLTNSSLNDYNLVCKLKSRFTYYDDNVMRYFVSIGKPKNFFNYGFDDPAQREKLGVSILNLDDTNLNFKFNDEKHSNCTGCSKYLKFDSVPFFVNICSTLRDITKTEVYEINRPVELAKKDAVSYDYGLSPNGQYFVNLSGVYDKKNDNYLLKFQNTSGIRYWDCNSYYFGIGYDVFPVQLLKSLLK